MIVIGCNSNNPDEGKTSSSSKTSSSATGEKIRIVLVPKKRGIDYFTACEKGAKEAADEFGDVELQYDGPIEDQPEKQAEIVETWVARRANVIGVACNDPVAIAPVLKKARNEGIHVLTWDADSEPDAREFFINQAPADRIAAALIDVMAKEAGPQAKTAIITSTLEAPNQNTWIKEMRAYQSKKYPRMKFVSVEQSKEDQQLAFKATQDVLKIYPDIKGLFAITSVAFPGTAEAVEQSGMKGKVAVTGLSTPKTMRNAVHKGVVKTVVLWNPVDLGYLTVRAARGLAKGTLKAGVKSLDGGRLGECTIKGDQVLLGDPKLFTKENIDGFDF